MHTQTNKMNGKHEPDEKEIEIAQLKSEIARLNAAVFGDASKVEIEDQKLEIDTKIEIESTLPKKSVFKGLRRALEVHNTYGGVAQRQEIANAVNRKGGHDLWDLILAALDAELLHPNDLNSAGRRLTLRVLFPWMPPRSSYSQRFDLASSRDRAVIRADILPVAIANKDAVMSNPDLLETLVYQERQRRSQEAQQERALSTLRDGESQVIIYGQMVWPRPDSKAGDYSFEQICAAARTFRDLDTWMKGSAHSKAIQIRNSTKWMRRHCASVISRQDEKSNVEKVYSLIHWMAHLLEQSPDKECRWPPTIHME
jgi:hypothetical protein